MKEWIIEVKEDPDTKDTVIEFPNDLLDAVGWKIGDTITWSVDKDGRCVITKVVDEAKLP